jgi:hypothetical protein
MCETYCQKSEFHAGGIRYWMYFVQPLYFGSLEAVMTIVTIQRYQRVINEICDFNWPDLSREDLMAVSMAYYYFSVQFCEAVRIACGLYPTDRKLASLREGELDTNNLSPCVGIADEGEKMNHDEFMRRVVRMSSLEKATQDRIKSLGFAYLAEVERADPVTRAMSLPAYEDGGLERVFRAILRAPNWDEPSLKAFHHFLVGHIMLDSDPDEGHGDLCRHLVPDDRILPLWTAFRDILVAAAPRLAK